MIRSSYRSIIRLDLRGKERFSNGCTAPPEPLHPFQLTFIRRDTMPSFTASTTLSRTSSFANALPSNAWYLAAPICIAGATAGAAILGPNWLPLALIGTVVGLMLVVLLNIHRVKSIPVPNPGIIETPFLLSHDKQVFELYRRLAGALLRVNQQSDFIFRDLALEEIKEAVDKLEHVAAGNIIYSDTETWRLAYEKLLRSPSTSSYSSVAVVRADNYWRDEPGRRSIQLNQELASAGKLPIERIAILDDSLWPKDAIRPAQQILQWLERQHRHGIKIRVARISAVAGESDLLVDLGIYGSRAVGVQEIDDEGRTARFTLSFDFDKVLAAEERWERLSIYATPFGDLV